jgi:hypothetical protein
MTKQEQQNLYKTLITGVITSDKTLKSQSPAFDFKSGNKLVLRVGKRTEFKTLFESTLKKQKVPSNKSGRTSKARYLVLNVGLTTQQF